MNKRSTDKANPSARSERRAGVALMLALVFIVVLTALVVEFTYDAQVDASLAISGDNRFQAWVAAKSAVAEGMALLAADLLESVGASQETAGTRGAQTMPRPTTQTSTPGSAQQGQMGTGMLPPGEYDSYFDGVPWSDGAPIKPLNDAVMRTTISDEFGKINLNALLVMNEGGTLEENEWLIQGLRNFFQLRDPELETDPVDAILDWLDYGDNDEERAEGAESSYYEGLEIPYPCKNGPMDSIEELLLIKGITPELYYGDPSQAEAAADRPEHVQEMESGEGEDAFKILPLSEYLTVHGDWEGKINANTAEYDVLVSVLTGYSETQGGSGFSPDLIAEQIFEYQYNEQPITSTSELDRMFPQRRRGSSRTGGLTTPRTGQKAGAGGAVLSPSPLTPGPATAGRNPGGSLPGATTGRAAEDIFRVDSNVFRIYGDGMLDNALVRIEAYVWRTPFDPGALQGGGTTDPFRILDWKVVQ